MLTAPSAVVSLQRPPPALMSAGRTEEQEKEKRGKRGATSRRRGERRASFDNGRLERNKNKHGFLQSRCPLPVCAAPVLPGGLSFIDKHHTRGVGGCFIRSHISAFLKRRLLGGGAGEEVEKTSQKAAEDWTLMLLLQLARPQHNEPVTQSKQIGGPSLNNGSAIAAFSHV